MDENAYRVRRPKDDWPQALQTGTSVPGRSRYFLNSRRIHPAELKIVIDTSVTDGII